MLLVNNLQSNETIDTQSPVLLRNPVIKAIKVISVALGIIGIIGMAVILNCNGGALLSDKTFVTFLVCTAFSVAMNTGMRVIALGTSRGWWSNPRYYASTA